MIKGRQVYVEGRIQTRDWEDRDGHKRTTTEIVATTVQFLSGGQSGARHDSASDPSTSDQGFNSSFDEADIPF